MKVILTLQQTANIFTISLWQIIGAYPVEILATASLIFLMMYNRMKNNEGLLSEEKLGLILSIMHKTQTPLSLIQHLLESTLSEELPKATLQKLERALKHANHVSACYQNVLIIDKLKKKLSSYSLSTIEFELYTYIISVSNQCRIYANSRQIQLNVSKNFTYISCQINEIVMTAALQCLLNKIIDATPYKGSVNIVISHVTDSWCLQISNCSNYDKNSKEMISAISALKLMPAFGSLRTIKKIIHLHGGKMTGSCHGETAMFKIIIPAKCYSNMANQPHLTNSAFKSTGLTPLNNENINNRNKLSSMADNVPNILLAMADTELSNYLGETLSTAFRITILEEPEDIFQFSIQHHPDAIIIDEIIKGVNGESLCSKIKSETNASSIPIILLISSDDNESYLSRLRCGADKLEMRVTNICKLKAEIQVLIDNHLAYLNQSKKVLPIEPETEQPQSSSIEEENAKFINKVYEVLEEKLNVEKYTIKKLSKDIGMSRTAFYNKMIKITGKPPTNCILEYRMNRAKQLLLTQQYYVTEVAEMVGYCNAKYFGKIFKKHFHVPPSDYLRSPKV